jgi:HK97 family phage prohead protease
MIIEYAAGKIEEAKEATMNGVKVGKVTGYITTFNPQRPTDTRDLPKFSEKAFEATIADHIRRDNRPVRMYSEHETLMGGFPVDTLHTDSVGLIGTGNVNLETQLGQEKFALARQGVLSDLSMAYTVTTEHKESDERIADSVDIYETSLVSEPANQGARIVSLESVTPRDLERILMLSRRESGLSRAMCKELASRLSEHAIEIEQEKFEQDALISSIERLTKSLNS